MLRYFLQQIKWYRGAGASWSMLSYYPRWKRALTSKSSTMQERMPWLSFPAIDLLNGTLKRSDKVFEYGGGGSTLFWIDRVAEVVTVEHDQAWFRILEDHMKGERSSKWEGDLVRAEDGDLVDRPDAADPEHYASKDEVSKGKNFKAYASRIDKFPDAYFDVILIDGRARTSCLSHAVPKLRSGGLLILDNAERVHYTAKNSTSSAQLEAILTGMAPCLHNRDFSETRIYRKR